MSQKHPTKRMMNSTFLALRFFHVQAARAAYRQVQEICLEIRAKEAELLHQQITMLIFQELQPGLALHQHPLPLAQEIQLPYQKLRAAEAQPRLCFRGPEPGKNPSPLSRNSNAPSRNCCMDVSRRSRSQEMSSQIQGMGSLFLYHLI